MMPLSFLFGRTESRGLFQRSRNCVLTTIAAGRHPQAHRMKVAACSDDGTHLWFVITRESGITEDVVLEPNVMLSVINHDNQELVHVSGRARVVGQHRSPLYLSPDFEQSQSLGVISEEADIALLSVDVSESREPPDNAGDSEPPHRIFRLFQAGPGNVSDTAERRGSQ